MEEEALGWGQAEPRVNEDKAEREQERRNEDKEGKRRLCKEGGDLNHNTIRQAIPAGNEGTSTATQAQSTANLAKDT